MNKKTFIIITITLFSTVWSFAQPKNERGDKNDRSGHSFGQLSERLQQEQIAFYTTTIGLTPEEAQKFWPLHNELNKKKGEAFSEQVTLRIQFQNNEKMTEKEATALMDSYAASLKKDADLTQYYHREFMKVLPAKKVMKMYLAEERFKSTLLQRIREDGRGQGQRNQLYSPWSPGFPWSGKKPEYPSQQQ